MTGSAPRHAVRGVLGVVALACLGATGCASALGLDAYQDAVDGGAHDGKVGGPADAAPARDAGGGATTDACPGAAVGASELFDFTTSTDGWIALHGGGTVVPAARTATSCAWGLEVTTHIGDWYGLAQPSAPLPMSLGSVHQIMIDVATTTAPTQASIAIEFGNDMHWCQMPFSRIAAGSTATVTVDIATLLTTPNACGSAPADTSILSGLWLFFDGGGVFYVEDVRTQ